MLNIAPSYYKALPKKIVCDNPTEPPVVVEGADYLGIPLIVVEQVELQVNILPFASFIPSIKEFE